MTEIKIPAKNIRFPEPHRVSEPVTRKYLNELIRSLEVLTTETEVTLFSSVEVIQKVGDFPNCTNDLIFLDTTKLYLIDGEVDLGTCSLVVPSGGTSIAALNGSRDVSSLTSSSDNYTMFKSPVGSYSGTLLLEELTFTVDGTASQVFELDNDENGNAVDLLAVNFVSCTSLGNLSAYRQLLVDGVGFIFIDEGFTFNGTWSGGITAVTSIAVGFPAAATLFAEGTSLVINSSFRSDMNFLSVDVTSIFCDFTESVITVDSGFTLNGFRTVASDPLPNLPGASTKVRYSSCTGVKNTYVGGEYTITSAVATSIGTANTFAFLEGITGYDDLQWFTTSSDNDLVYDSSVTIEYETKGALSFSGTNNNVVGVQVRQFNASAAAFQDVGSVFTGTMNAGGRVENLSFFARGTLNKDDRIGLWIENQSAASNITATVGGFVGISERPS